KGAVLGRDGHSDSRESVANTSIGHPVLPLFPVCRVLSGRYRDVVGVLIAAILVTTTYPEPPMGAPLSRRCPHGLLGRESLGLGLLTLGGDFLGGQFLALTI